MDSRALLCCLVKYTLHQCVLQNLRSAVKWMLSCFEGCTRLCSNTRHEKNPASWRQPNSVWIYVHIPKIYINFLNGKRKKDKNVGGVFVFVIVVAFVIVYAVIFANVDVVIIIICPTLGILSFARSHLLLADILKVKYFVQAEICIL